MYHKSVDIFGFTFAARLISERAVNCRIVSVHDLIGGFALEMAGYGQVCFIAVSVRPDAPALIFLNETSRPGVKAALTAVSENFTRALRFHLEGTNLDKVLFPPGERRGEFYFSKRTEFGKEIARILVVEIMGRHSGAFILNEKRQVASSARKYDPSKNKFRKIVTGKMYPDPPALAKQSVIGISLDEFVKTIAGFRPKKGDESAISAFQAIFSGLTRDLLIRIFETANADAEIGISRLVEKPEVLERIFGLFSSLERGERLYEIFGLSSAETLLADYFDTVFVRKAQVGATSPRKLSGSDRRTKLIAEELERVRKHPAIMELAGWLVETASEEKALGTPISVDLKEKAISVAKQTGCPDDLAKLFEKNDAPEIIAGMLVKTAERYKSAVTKLEFFLESAESAPDVLSVQDVSTAETLNKKRQIELAGLKKLGIKHKVLTSSDGVPIVVGLSDKANDALLKRYGSTPHWWFHSRDVPGSWVIALTGRAALPDRTRIECAIVAAAHSKDKGEHSVDVSYTQMKYLRKPKNAPPGRVLMREEKSVAVNPAEFAALKDKLQWQ